MKYDTESLPWANKMIDHSFNAVFGSRRYSNHFGAEKAICPRCGKTVKAVGLSDHIRDVHKTRESE